MSSEKSTNVRIYTRLLRAGLGALAAVSPPAAGRIARDLFFRAPPKRRTNEREAEVLARGARVDVDFEDHTLATWMWGDGPTVMLVHGWAGSAAQLTPLVEPLVRVGFRVVAHDLPGHGQSGGRWLSIPRAASSVARVASLAGAPHAIVAHSFGALASSFAMRQGLSAGRAVFIGPPSDASDWFERFREHLELDEAVSALTRDAIVRRVGFPIETFRATTLGPSIAAPLLVIHDRDDREVPWSDGDTFARSARRGVLLTTRGLGHRRVLRDPAVSAEIARFLSRPLEARPTAEVQPSAGALAVDACSRCGATDATMREPDREALCARCALDLHLFDRASRWATAA